MAKYVNCVIDPQEVLKWQAPDGSRENQPLITQDICGAETCLAGLWSIRPGLQCATDIHNDADELYYVVAGEGELSLDDEVYPVREGMTIFIPRGVSHRTRNTGATDLTYYWVFAPPSRETSRPEAEGWKKIEAPDRV